MTGTGPAAEPAAEPATEPVRPSMARVLGRRGFRLLFIGSTTSLLGDQFALVAMPWLALQLTGDPLTLGVVLALEGVPRAVFMLLGGVVTDRLSPRVIMLVSDVVRMVLTAALAALVAVGMVHTWMLYAFALGFGLVAGFAVPASTSIVPTLVDEFDLQAGNSLVMGAEQLVGFVGPSVAGLLISAYTGSFAGIVLAFGVDAITFAVSAVCLALMAGESGPLSDGSDAAGSVWSSILAGLRYLWQDRPLRLVFLLLTAVNFLLIGPIMVGIPVLADQRLAQGAVAFGLLMSAYAGGNLLGYLLAGSLPRPRAGALRAVFAVLLFGFGVVFVAIGVLDSTWVDAALLLGLGLGNGYLAILLFTWLQKRTPRAMLGRMMSILMLSTTGLMPVSQAISGAVCTWDVTALFASAGALVVLVTLIALPRPEFTSFSRSLAAGATGEPGASA